MDKLLFMMQKLPPDEFALQIADKLLQIAEWSQQEA